MTAWTIAAGMLLAAIPLALMGLGFAVRFSSDTPTQDGSAAYGLMFGAAGVASAAVVLWFGL